MHARDDRISYRALQWLVAVFAGLHNLEEALTMPTFAPLVRARLSGVVPSALLTATENLSVFYGALIAVTLIPFLVVLAAASAPQSRALAWTVLLVQSIFFVNVFIPHVPAAIALGGYAPGVATAVAIQLPFSVYFLRRSVREGVVSRAGAGAALVLAIPALLLVFAALVLGAQ